MILRVAVPRVLFRIVTTCLLLSFPSCALAIDITMIDMEDILENHRIVTHFSKYNGPYSRGTSLIKSSLKNLLSKTANQDSDACASSMDSSGWHEVQTTYLTATSNYHQDHKHNDGTLVEEEVGFVALNTNYDAYFDHPDMKVPIREGVFVRFKGSEPHRTVVNNGKVHLLGPFDLKSFGKVGGCRKMRQLENHMGRRTEDCGTPEPSWQTRANLNVGIGSGANGAVLGDVFFLINYDGSVEAYSPQTDVWYQVSNYPSSSSYTYGLQAVALNDSLHVIAYESNQVSHRFMTPSVDTSIWNAAASFQKGYTDFGGAAVTVGDKIYAFGDIDNSCSYSDIIRVYDPSTSGWTTLNTTMVEQRDAPTATLVGTKVYLIGKDACQSDAKIMEVFDTVTSVSSLAGIDQSKIPFTRIMRHTAVAIDDMIYVIGGLGILKGSNSWVAFDKVWCYNPAEDEWSEKPSLPSARQFSTSFTYGREIFVVGGLTSSYQNSDSTFSLSIESQEPTTLSPTNSPTFSTVVPTPYQTSVAPSVASSEIPSVEPSVAPSADPSALPSLEPSAEPSEIPSVEPSAEPSTDPSAVPSTLPSLIPSVDPSEIPSVEPSGEPSTDPSALPSLIPSVDPSGAPSIEPSAAPSGEPSVVPSSAPSLVPSAEPSGLPSSLSSSSPSTEASEVPSSSPTVFRTESFGTYIGVNSELTPVFTLTDMELVNVKLVVTLTPLWVRQLTSTDTFGNIRIETSCTKYAFVNFVCRTDFVVAGVDPALETELSEAIRALSETPIAELKSEFQRLLREATEDDQVVVDTFEIQFGFRGLCVDDPGFRTKKKGKDCNWVAKHTRSRCKLKGNDGRLAQESCPSSCDLRCSCQNSDKYFRIKDSKKKVRKNKKKAKCSTILPANEECKLRTKPDGVVADFCPELCNDCYNFE